MKIVGSMDDGYLAQISEDEIAIITGFSEHVRYGDKKKQDDFAEKTGRQSLRETIRTNTVIEVVRGLRYITTLVEKCKTAKRTAKELRELADMLDNPLPVVIAPEDSPCPPQT